MASEKKWFILELNTGAVEGCWGLEGNAHQSVKYFEEERYKGSTWVVCSLDTEQMDKASRYCDFPSERIAHEERFRRKEFIERVLEDA